MPRNPRWETEELILALNLYFNVDVKSIAKNAKDITELSKILQRMPINLDARDDNYRNNDSVYSKLMNFRYLDPSQNGRGLKNGSKMDKVIWNEYSNNKTELAAISKVLINEFQTISIELPVVDEEEAGEFPEGKISYRMHKQRERNIAQIKKIKEKAYAEGKLKCCICGFDFEEKYGVRGRGFIECHHTKPISEYIEGEKTKESDLILVCANCHRMLHKSRPWISKEELASLIKK